MNKIVKQSVLSQTSLEMIELEVRLVPIILDAAMSFTNFREAKNSVYAKGRIGVL